MSKRPNVVPCLVVFGALGLAAHGAAIDRKKTKVQLRGHSESLYVYRAVHMPARRWRVLFAPGDAGCRGFAIDIAEKLAETGYDTYCFDTLQYLRSITSGHVLTTSDIASDFRTVAHSISQGRAIDAKLLLVGWSEGAGLGLVAAAASSNRDIFVGMVAIGTPEVNILAWRWRDATAWITRSVPREPTFKSADFVHAVSPLPLFFIASSSGEYVSPEATRVLFSKASGPKQLVVVNARDHKYSGNRDKFFAVLRQALEWVEHNATAQPPHAPGGH